MEDERVIKISPRIIHRLFGGEYDDIYKKYKEPVTISEYKEIYKKIYNAIGGCDLASIKKKVNNISVACGIHELLNLHSRIFVKRIPKDEWIELKKWVSTYK